MEHAARANSALEPTGLDLYGMSQALVTPAAQRQTVIGDGSMRTLTAEAFNRAKAFMHESARPLERARFAHEFEGGRRQAVLAALEAFRNDDGGFGHALEPDLWMPSSSVLCTVEGLHVLREVHVPASHAFVTGAVDWLVAAFDPKLAAWRSVTEGAETCPHAPHWKWELHADGTRWPVGVLPRAEVLSHLWRSADRVPRELLEDQTRRLVADFASCESLGPDSLARCDMFARTPEAPRDARDAVARRMLEVGTTIASRDPEEWSSYSAKPLKLAPTPDCILAEPLAPDLARNLDWEIEHQAEDGSWVPNWTWGGAFPDDWAVAEHWWRGDITLRTLRSLHAYGRIEGS
jgi:hypothetical protein